MIALLLDTETSGLPLDSKIIELGAALVDTNNWTLISTFEMLVYDPRYPVISKEIEQITKITQQMLVTQGIYPITALDSLWDFGKKAEFIIAHHVEFDKNIIKNSCKEYGLVPYGLLMTPWLCSKKDIQYNVKNTCKRLAHLALDHGIEINPKELHRALADVKLMLKLLKVHNVPGKYLLQYAQSKSFVMEAVTKHPKEDNGASKDIAKKDGFQWNPESKNWTKIVKQTEIEIEKKKTKLEVRIYEYNK